MALTRFVPLTANAVQLVRECRDWIARQEAIDGAVRRAFPAATGVRVSWEGPPVGRVVEWLNVLTCLVSEFETEGGANGGT